MSVGLEEAARREGRPLGIPLAVDFDDDVVGVYRANLAYAQTQVADMLTLFDGDLGEPATRQERALANRVGEVDVLLGGPPCQGHSDLNNYTRRNDPKNTLYTRMARAAEVLNPKVVVVENVATVQWDEAGVVKTTSAALAGAGYEVGGRVLDLRSVGVPQRRRRFLLLASNVADIAPAAILDQLFTGIPGHPDRTVRWAIEDLLPQYSDTTYNSSSRSSSKNTRRIAYLFEKRRHDLPNTERPECHQGDDHSYLSMYGRLWWDRPAQTITTGFGSMGQGRYVHPGRRRTITPHEAARLQTFPDWFDFGEETGRGALAKMIGNAVPPLLMVALGTQIVRGLSAATLRARKHA